MSKDPQFLRFNPADYFTFVLGQEIREAAMPGGYAGFALQLSAEPDLDHLQQRLDLLLQKFPKASARIEKQGKRHVWVPTGQPIVLERHQCRPGVEVDGETQRIVLEILNRTDSMPLHLHWIAAETGGTLLLHWNHPLLDARGAKIILDFLNSDRPESFQDGPSLMNAKLAQFSLWQYVKMFFKVKRHNHAVLSVDSCLPTEVETGPHTLKLKIRRFSEAETRQISQLARQYTGLAGKSLYYIGCFMRAMEFVGPPVAKEAYCVPYAFNLRRQNAPTPVFGNHVGCLFARASREQTQDRQGLFQHLLADHREVVKQEIDLAYLPFMWLGQWLSPARYAKFLRKQYSGNEISSLWFSDIGELSWAKQGFLGCQVTGMFHLCWMTVPPGLALLVGQLDGRLALSYSYLHPAIDEAWLEQVLQRMDAELLEQF